MSRVRTRILLPTTLLGLALLLAAARPLAAQDILRAKVKSLDVEGGKLVVVVDGKERELVLTDQTRVLEATGDTLEKRLAKFAPGADIQFRAVTQDGKDVAVGLRFAGDDARPRNRPGIRPGKVAALDLEAKTVTLDTPDGQKKLTIPDDVQVPGSRGQNLTERFRDVKVGAEVRFVAGERDGKAALVAIAPGGGRPQGGGQAGRPVSPEHGHFKPLTDLGREEYQGFAGGLYPEGRNERPAAHEAAGKKLAAEVQPLDAQGRPAKDGRIVLLSIGMSNTSQASGGFAEALRGFEQRNPALVFVNGAQGGMTAETIDDPNDGGRGARYWAVVDEQLARSDVTRAQVQVAWIKQADAGPREGFPAYAKKLHGELKTIVQILRERFPNLKLCYLSSRTYGGFATTGLNPEPYAYESGFSVNWLIEEQLAGDAGLAFDPAKGPAKAPWLSWGPYLWSNGATKRADGFSYAATDFVGDGTHHAPEGSRKIGRLMLDFFRSDSTTRPWFVKSP